MQRRDPKDTGLGSTGLPGGGDLEWGSEGRKESARQKSEDDEGGKLSARNDYTHVDTEKMALSIRFVINSKSLFCIIVALVRAFMGRCACLWM